jgi:ribokinase
MSDATHPPSIVVVGSVNLDLAAEASRLPVPGETVTGAELRRFPGGKGGNQALAARRLGADVQLISCVGRDAAADEALALLREGGVDLSRCCYDEELPTGVALICIGPSGENYIVVAPGANRSLLPGMLDLPDADALMCQLEVPSDTLCRAAETFNGFFCANLAPAMDIPDSILLRADLVVVNETEAMFYGDALRACSGFIAVTRGKAGATLFRHKEIVAEAEPPEVVAVDTTGAGDTFTAALTIGLIEKTEPQRALRFACVASALATTSHGAQPSMPYRTAVEAAIAAK